MEPCKKFARRYQQMIRACLVDRWRGKPLAACIDDVVQEVWHDCFKAQGALERADPHQGEFRGFLFGVVRTCALRAESMRARERGRMAADASDLDTLVAKGDRLSVMFDRQWARAVVHEARRVQTEHAKSKGEPALRRLEMLRMRFEEDCMPRRIAEQMGLSADVVSQELLRAKNEFLAALAEVIAFHHPHASASWIEDEVKRILDLLGQA